MDNVALSFILYGPIALLLLGVILPISYNSIVKKRPLSTTGIKKEYWLPSLALGGALGIITYLDTLGTIELPSFRELLPLVMMALTVGLFEAVFFRGWIQLRFEKAFGAIPAIIIGAMFYSLYHIGYGMTVEEMWFLFFLGISFAFAFRVTKNILVLWPFYTWLGGLYTNISEGLRIPFESTYGFVNVLAWMIIFPAILYFKKFRSNKQYPYQVNTH
jgi:membrane protease YdiL (CAAX protease family)